MKQSYLILLIVLILAGALSACQSAACDPEIVVVTSEVTVVVVVTPTPVPEVAEVTPEPFTPAPAEGGDWLLPDSALEHVGEVAEVRLEEAHCSYQANTNGTPTFCNDQPYPGHNFTFVTWGQDWSHFDGKCVIVEGEIEVYDGKAQIEAEDEAQVRACP